MGEGKKDALRVNFDKKLKLEFHGVKVTSDAGLLAYKEIDDVFGFTEKLELVKIREVKVYTRTEIGRVTSLKNPCFCVTVHQIPPDKRMLDSLSGILVEILVSNGEIMGFNSVYGKSQLIVKYLSRKGINHEEVLFLNRTNRANVSYGGFRQLRWSQRRYAFHKRCETDAL